MNILIVDDNPSKTDAISAAISRALQLARPYSLSVVGTINGAVRILSLMTFDLIVLDLMLPYVEDGTRDSQAGFELLKQLRSADGRNKNTPVLALSEFPDEVSTYRHKFDELGVLIMAFNDGDSWRQALLRVVEGVSKTSAAIDVDFLIITALEEERKGFSKYTEEASDAVVAGLNVKYVRPLSAPDLLGAIIRLSHMGLVTATFETAAALRAFRTSIVGMSGICAGFKARTQLGQLVVASPAWEYQAGKWSDDDFEIAPMQVALRPATRAHIDRLIGNIDFKRGLESCLDVDDVRPTRLADPLLAPFATGSAVIADTGRLQHIVKQHRKVAAIDMEAYGVYYAANESVQVEHFFCVKAVVDFADRKKSDNFHKYGSAVSANAALQIASSLAKLAPR